MLHTLHPALFVFFQLGRIHYIMKEIFNEKKISYLLEKSKLRVYCAHFKLVYLILLLMALTALFSLIQALLDSTCNAKTL